MVVVIGRWDQPPQSYYRSALLYCYGIGQHNGTAYGIYVTFYLLEILHSFYMDVILWWSTA